MPEAVARYEREVASERIRDKIAATVKQGYWVCGKPTLGDRLQLEIEPRGLYIIAKESDLVRNIFGWSIETKSLVAPRRPGQITGLTMLPEIRCQCSVWRPAIAVAVAEQRRQSTNTDPTPLRTPL